jgi:hypothetical protein
LARTCVRSPATAEDYLTPERLDSSTQIRDRLTVALRPSAPLSCCATSMAASL